MITEAVPRLKWPQFGPVEIDFHLSCLLSGAKRGFIAVEFTSHSIGPRVTVSEINSLEAEGRRDNLGGEEAGAASYVKEGETGPPLRRFRRSLVAT